MLFHVFRPDELLGLCWSELYLQFLISVVGYYFIAHFIPQVIIASVHNFCLSVGVICLFVFDKVLSQFFVIMPMLSSWLHFHFIYVIVLCLLF